MIHSDRLKANDLPKAGEEWFSRDRLTVVHVMQVESGNVIYKSGPYMRDVMFFMQFMSHYARNEPVTLELLERMGWECETFTDTAEGGVLSRGVIDLPDDNDFRIYFRDGNPLSATVISGGEVPIPFPATLRDLLNVLRVFGVESSVTADGRDNQT